MIPLFGLNQKVDIIRKSDAYDCAGNIEKDADTPALYSNVCTRITTMRMDEEVHTFGNASGKRWTMTCQFVPNALESDFVRIAPNVFPNVVGNETQDYRILRVVHKQDFSGCMHHTNLIIELE